MASKRAPVPPEGQLLIYQDGGQRIQVRIDGRTVWLTRRNLFWSRRKSFAGTGQKEHEIKVPNNPINTDWQFHCTPLPAGYSDLHYRSINVFRD